MADERRLTPHVTVLVGTTTARIRPATRSRRGAGEAVVIDPSVTVVAMGGAPAAVDAVINSHSHEDHIAGNGSSPTRGSTSTVTTCPASPASTG